MVFRSKIVKIMETKKTKTKQIVPEWKEQLNKQRRERRRAVRAFEDERQLRIDGLTDAEYNKIHAAEIAAAKKRKRLTK